MATRQDLQCGHEGQGDGFGLLVAGLRAGPRVRSVERRTCQGPEVANYKWW